MKRPWTASVIETLSTNPYFSVLLQDVVLPDGSRREYYTLDFSSVAVGVVARRDGRTLLVRQYRFIIDEFVWAIPSGGVATDETPERAALRELEEETGYHAESLVPLVHFCASYGCSNQRFEIFLADNVSATGRDFDTNEVIKLQWFDRRELLQLLLTNGIVDSLSLVPLLILMLREQSSVPA